MMSLRRYVPGFSVLLNFGEVGVGILMKCIIFALKNKTRLFLYGKQTHTN